MLAPPTFRAAHWLGASFSPSPLNMGHVHHRIKTANSRPPNCDAQSPFSIGPSWNPVSTEGVRKATSITRGCSHLVCPSLQGRARRRRVTKTATTAAFPVFRSSSAPPWAARAIYSLKHHPLQGSARARCYLTRETSISNLASHWWEQFEAILLLSLSRCWQQRAIPLVASYSAVCDVDIGRDLPFTSASDWMRLVSSLFFSLTY